MWHDMSMSFSFICVSCSVLGRAKVYRVLFVFHKTLSHFKRKPFSWESCGFVLQCCIWRLEMSLLFIENVIGRVCMLMYIYNVVFATQSNKYEVLFKKESNLLRSSWTMNSDTNECSSTFFLFYLNFIYSL